MEVSWSITRSMPGRIAFTTTSRPSFSTALWTWATEAEASGCRSNLRKASSTGWRRACSTMRTNSSAGNGGTSSCSLLSSRQMSTGTRSGRVDRSWPNLTKMGPRSSIARRRRTPREAFGSGRMRVSDTISRRGQGPPVSWNRVSRRYLTAVLTMVIRRNSLLIRPRPVPVVSPAAPAVRRAVPCRPTGGVRPGTSPGPRYY